MDQFPMLIRIPEAHDQEEVVQTQPDRHVREMERLHKDVWADLVKVRAKWLQDHPNPPAWLFTSIVDCFPLLLRRLEKRGVEPQLEHVTIPALWVALFTWRQTKRIFRFDPDLWEMLRSTPLTAELDINALNTLPVWCVYVQFPEPFEGLVGFYAHHEYDHRAGRRELRLVLDHGDSIEALQTWPIHLTGGNLQDCIRAALEGALNSAPDLSIPERVDMLATAAKLEGLAAPLLNALLYLCSIEADVVLAGKQSKRRGPIPEQSTHYDVGVRVGGRMRAWRQAEASQPTGATVRPHVRRAHWHTYLTGKGRAERVIKWISPIFVKGTSELVPTHIQPL